MAINVTFKEKNIKILNLVKWKKQGKKGDQKICYCFQKNLVEWTNYT